MVPAVDSFMQAVSSSSLRNGQESATLPNHPRPPHSQLLIKLTSTMLHISPLGLTKGSARLSEDQLLYSVPGRAT